MNEWQHECFRESHDAKSFDCERSVPQTLAKSVRGICSAKRRRRNWLLNGISGLTGTILISIFLLTSAFAQEQQRHAYSEYTFWYGGAFGNGHAFSNTINARNYQFENRYERLIYWSEPFAVRWVFDLTSALVGDPHWGRSSSLFLRYRWQSHRRTSKLRALPPYRTVPH